MTNSEWIEKLRAAAAMCQSQDGDLDYKYWAAVAFDMLPKASGHITELEAKVAALQEIAEAERAKRILDGDPEKKFDFVGLTECPSHNEYCDDNCYLERCPSERFWRSVASRQLSEEHPEAFR